MECPRWLWLIALVIVVIGILWRRPTAIILAPALVLLRDGIAGSGRVAPPT